MSRSFWPAGEAAQADYERLRGLALAATPAVDVAARRFERHGLWGLIACPQAAPALCRGVVGAERAAWSPYQDLRELALARRLSDHRGGLGRRATRGADGMKVAIYARVSSEGQERRGTIRSEQLSKRVLHLSAVGWRRVPERAEGRGRLPGFLRCVAGVVPRRRACLDYLDWLRWPDGFRCPLCAGKQAWRLPDGRWSCGRCGRRVSPTAGTIFHGTRTPLTVWFAAAWQMTSQKHGISALGLKRTLGIGSEQTAWAMLHRYRTAMVRPGRDRLSGIVEVDETFIGGPEPGRPRARRAGQDAGRDRRRAATAARWAAAGMQVIADVAPRRCGSSCSPTCSPARS